MHDWLAKNLIHKSEIRILECKSLQIVESTSNRSIQLEAIQINIIEL